MHVVTKKPVKAASPLNEFRQQTAAETTIRYWYPSVSLAPLARAPFRGRRRPWF